MHILAIGKKHEDWVLPGIERYQKRLKAPFNCKWVLLPHSSLDGDSARAEESQRLLDKLPARGFCILLDETGAHLDSPALTTYLQQRFNAAQDVWFIIGGAYGVDARIKERADLIWSLSLLVFPHQLVRLLLTEQLYRAQQISAGSPYHHA